MRKSLLLPFVLLWAACPSGQDHLITSDALRHSVQQQLVVQKQLAQQRQAELFGLLEQPLRPAEREALEWLFAWMPLSDLADYDGGFYLRQVRATLQARAEMAWGRRVPAALFLHFVLPVRVNNENLDSARVVLYGALKPRVAGLSMRQAILEINHWCHEHVTYRSADMRTSAPLATLRSAIGRCGEESVFTVAALRAVGIPARQVYVPRWAHSDDNHAWVEAWADGTWYFLGACEPEPDLNMGWFKEPARRAMLVHTRVMGPYAGPEEPLASSARHREINVLGRYAVTKKLVVRSVGPEGTPLAGAGVSFRLYNYAEFYPLARQISDASGGCSLETGLGDLLIWAHHGSLAGFAQAHAAAQDTVTVTLQPGPRGEEILDLDFAPPLARPPLPDTIAAAARDLHARRLAHEDSLRKAYIATYMDSLTSARLAQEAGLPPDPLWPLLRKSRGNHDQIARFIREGAALRRPMVLPLLQQLSEKDLRDARAEVLLDHLAAAGNEAHLDSELMEKYILNPRIRNEALVAWRRLLGDGFSPAFRDSARANPLLLAAWVQRHIRVDSTANYYAVPLTPRGVWALRIADPLSRDIFLIALSRTCGIPARLDPAFDKPCYFDLKQARWQPLETGSRETAKAAAALTLKSSDATIARPEYWTHFTLGRLKEGEYKTLELEGLQLERGTARLVVPAGAYQLITGWREPDGTVLSRLHFFTLQSGQSRAVELSWRREAQGKKPIGMLPAGAELALADSGAPVSLAQFARPKGLILAWLDPGREPSQHILREWQDLRPLYEAWGGAMVVMVAPEQAARLGEYRLPGQLRLGEDPQDKLLRSLEASLPGGPLVIRPVLIYADPGGSVLLLNQGYQVGLGDRLLQTIRSSAP
ncbi:MAG TPA: transglutaminase-like domain-containing protein [bacterium]|nr:transglutaminase-like domain-containing protein [bacterium]